MSKLIFHSVKPLAFLLFLLLAFLMAPARHHTQMRPCAVRPVVRVLRSPQAPKVVRRVGTAQGIVPGSLSSKKEELNNL